MINKNVKISKCYCGQKRFIQGDEYKSVEMDNKEYDFHNDRCMSKFMNDFNINEMSLINTRFE
ncbi:hypothetical protein IFU39_16680 [Paenibacillus sp. CFBP 13594]|uniref:hypothetical protein n=1 Tax=Paenibacillus sp. CFBP 13594 TaxID=2774037 RepID=UPI0017806863|nr:hypothetical protein [Paenibacillus sp. CFBP 13594]MBD8839450.1 hypothetical protein [Paenibacillus sp. CFBP 13594]